MRFAILLSMLPLGAACGPTLAREASPPRWTPTSRPAGGLTLRGDPVAHWLNRLLAAHSLGELERMERKARCDATYRALYANALARKKPFTLDEAAYAQQLAGYAPFKNDDYWHRRRGHAGGVKRPIRRFFLNLMPDAAPRFSNLLCGALNEAKLRFSYKLTRRPRDLARRHTVLYVRRDDYARAKVLVLALAARHERAFAEGDPPFTRRLRRGVGVAHDLGKGPLPAGRPRHSFGTLRSDIYCEVLGAAAAERTRAQLLEALRARFRHYGLDPWRPALAAGEADDL